MKNMKSLLGGVFFSPFRKEKLKAMKTEEMRKKGEKRMKIVERKSVKKFRR